MFIYQNNVDFDDQLYNLQLWDVSDQLIFSDERSMCYAHADCCLFVFALDHFPSLHNFINWRDELLTKVIVSDLNTFPFVVAANKSDLPKYSHHFDDPEISSFCADHGMNYVDTSAINAVNVEEVFNMVAHRGKMYTEGLAARGMHQDSCILKLTGEADSESLCAYCEPRFRHLV